MTPPGRGAEEAMTLDEFLDDYTPNVLKSKRGGRWEVIRGYVRFADHCCPITAGFNVAALHYRDCAEKLGLPMADARKIAAAADEDRQYPGYDSAIRLRLLRGLGLSGVHDVE